jgi:hypothetical protein
MVTRKERIMSRLACDKQAGCQLEVLIAVPSSYAENATVSSLERGIGGLELMGGTPIQRFVSWRAIKRRFLFCCSNNMSCI